MQKSKGKINKVDRGFTLIEILVVLFITVIIAAVAGDTLISTLRSSGKTNVFNEINQNQNFVLGTIEATARNAKSAFLNGGNLTIIDQFNQRHEFQFATDTINYSGTNYGVGVVKKSLAGGPFYLITNSHPLTGVFVVTPDSRFSVSATLPPLITVCLRLREGPAASNLRIENKGDVVFPCKSFAVRKY